MDDLKYKTVSDWVENQASIYELQMLVTLVSMEIYKRKVVTPDYQKRLIDIDD